MNAKNFLGGGFAGCKNSVHLMYKVPCPGVMAATRKRPIVMGIGKGPTAQ